MPGTKNLVSSVSDCFRNQWAVLEAQGKVEVDYSISANRPEAQVQHILECLHPGTLLKDDVYSSFVWKCCLWCIYVPERG